MRILDFAIHGKQLFLTPLLINLILKNNNRQLHTDGRFQFMQHNTDVLNGIRCSILIKMNIYDAFIAHGANTISKTTRQPLN